MRPIYLDNNATTRLDPRVLKAMLPFLREEYGNASSHAHAFGRRARAAVETARAQVARLIGAQHFDVVFTSGATESDNLALKGVVRANTARGRHLIASVVEHKAVLDAAKALEREGASVTRLPAGETGRIEAAAVEAALQPNTVLVSLMAANNEIGTLSPIGEIGALCKAHGVIFHTDATQAVGRVPLDVEAMGVDLLSLSAHKLHGPKGIGALYVRSKRPRVRCEPILHGGGHENGLRSGTLNVPGIVGLGMACAIAAESLSEEATRLMGLRDRLWEAIAAGVPEARRNGHPTEVLPNTLNVCFGEGLRPEMLFAALPDLAVSSGSACTTAALEPSYVLRAIGRTEGEAYGSLRFSLGRFDTAEDIEEAAARVVAGVRGLRR